MTADYQGSPGDNFDGTANDQSTAQYQADAAYGAFPEDRWRRVGATDDEVEKLRAAHEKKSPDKQADEGRRLASLHDDDVTADLEKHRARWNKSAAKKDGADDGDEPTYEGTVEEVLEQVDGDPERAAKALEIEQAGKNRVTLVESLQKIANGEDNE